MANDGSVIIDIEGDSSKFKSALSGLGSIASTALKGVTTAVAAVTTAVAGVATAAVKVGSGFESSMSQVAATMGLTVEDIRNGSEEFELLSQAAKDAGATTAFSASEASDALNYLALAGYDAATSADVLPSVLNLAAAGGLDLAYASDLATDAMAALGIEASSANLTEFGDKMAKTASKANTSVGQLGEAILTVGGTAKSLAGGTTELNAALGVLANRGIKGAEGGTALRNVILALSAPTDKAADAMSALGLEVYDAAGNMRPLNEVFRDLDSALSGMTEGEKTKVLNEIFNKVDLKSAQALLAGCGEEFDNLAAAIDDSAGAMQNMADTQLDNLQGDITIMKSALEGLGIGVYENLQAPLRDTVQFATELVGQLSEALKENGLEGLVSAAGDVLSEVLLKITSELPKFIDIGVKVIKSLISGLLKNKNGYSAEYQLKTKSGAVIWVSLRAVCITDRLGEPLRVIGVMTDIDNEKKLELQLSERASYDFLSQLYNRNTFIRNLTSEIERRGTKRVAVSFIDVDDFKFINDRYGHTIGDEVIRFVADTIRTKVDDRGGFAGRFGGDEFVLCFTNQDDIANIENISMDIINELYEGYTTADGAMHIDVAFCPEHTEDVNELLSFADTAMYFVKKNGKTNYHIYIPEDSATDEYIDPEGF